ncbi:LysR family transcriptional regulator [Carnobacteriaceae bacterium zg-ZUI252]|nr:LysR family transcriptional regulator [Carnobacteriaceae bacterium zg-ZUI252]MBS4769712.1 LysR family transcriptional regulator [Carnobacteriaceae bacterium zg-ZUI240]QTU83125.1 LysR family transcriptional regulator [Carnobacteriaceae bacterium zg-C25]
MDIKQLHYFIEIFESGGFSKASRNLFLTQPTLSAAMKKLESECNTKLFHFQNNKIVLTQAGQFLYQRSKTLVEEFQQLTLDMQQFQHIDHEKITVGLPTLFAMQFMPVFSKFMLDHPNVDLTLTQGGSKNLQAQLASGEIDIGILSFPKYEDSITIDPFKSERGYTPCIVAPANHPIAKNNSLSFNDLKNEQFSSFSQRFILGRYLKKRAKECQFTPKIIYTDDNWEVLLSSVNQLNSVCLMAKEYQDYYNNNDLKWIPIENDSIHIPIGVAYRQNYPYSQNISLLIQTLRAL